MGVRSITAHQIYIPAVWFIVASDRQLLVEWKWMWCTKLLQYVLRVNWEKEISFLLRKKMLDEKTLQCWLDFSYSAHSFSVVQATAFHSTYSHFQEVTAPDFLLLFLQFASISSPHSVPIWSCTFQHILRADWYSFELLFFFARISPFLELSMLYGWWLAMERLTHTRVIVGTIKSTSSSLGN